MKNEKTNIAKDNKTDRERVSRGGCWLNNARDSRVSRRNRRFASFRNYVHQGFRLVLQKKKK
jgi:formylglycine-generating enzyme required for sulfatase activity